VRREPSDAELLRAWERARPTRRLERPLILLASLTGKSVEQAANLPLGRRDRELLQLREGLFGTQIDSVALCRSCNEQMELSIAVTSLLELASTEPADSYEISVEKHQVIFRLPTTNDLLAVADDDPKTARTALVERCILHAERSGRSLPPCQLSAAVVAAIGERLRQADPYTDVLIELRCPACGEEFSEPFDIATFLWDELDRWARRLLEDVAALAKAYGWAEQEVIELSPLRRQAYLELASA